MTSLIEEYKITEKREGAYVSYLLNDDEAFSQVGFKVMKSQELDSFLKCACVKFNGKIKLIYAVEKLQNLPAALAAAPPHGAWVILSKVIEGILKVRNNGFLGYENLDISAEHIYLDEKTSEPNFIYLPLVSGMIENAYAKFDQEFKANMKEAVRASGALVYEQKKEIIDLLGAGNGSLDDINREIAQHIHGIPSDLGLEGGNELRLVSMDRRIPLSFAITKNKFTIGRRKENDAVVDFSNKISRQHCSVVKMDGRFGIVDANSTFGTWVNSTKCMPGKVYEIKPGDRVRLPDIIFEVQ